LEDSSKNRKITFEEVEVTFKEAESANNFLKSSKNFRYRSWALLGLPKIGFQCNVAL